MSGGSWDYVYSRIDDIADRLTSDANPLRRAMVPSVRALAKAMRAIEWVDSGDYGDGDDEELIRDFLASCGSVDAAVLSVLICDAKEAHARLGAALDRATP